MFVDPHKPDYEVLAFDLEEEHLDTLQATDLVTWLGTEDSDLEGNLHCSLLEGYDIPDPVMGFDPHPVVLGSATGT